jgi:opacity protein-like surface antigen
MNKYLISVFIATLFSVSIADAQVIMGVGPGFGHRFRSPLQRNRFQQDDLPRFEPSVNLSIGYGFPNQDKYELADFYNYYKGNLSQSGPVTGALDYQFSRNMSIGVMVTHGKVSVPYYDYNNPYTSVLKGSLDNWAFMLNIVRYMPVNSSKISPYIRTAIGINSWTQNYTDSSGSKINLGGAQPNDFAYQVGIGAKFKLSKNAGIFAEAGYGKYILHGGAFFKF